MQYFRDKQAFTGLEVVIVMVGCALLTVLWSTRGALIGAAMIAGFTLIEISIVLVIIGLIIGGVLAGRELIEQSTIRATIAQLGEYKTAVNSFRSKYNGLPGDLPNGGQLGFPARNTYPGTGDGNGRIEGAHSSGGYAGTFQRSGETVVFWTDLSMSGLINGSFTLADNIPSGATITEANLGRYFPRAKLASDHYILAFNDGAITNWNWAGDSHNYFSIQSFTRVDQGIPWHTNVGDERFRMPVHQAYSIDSKMDDGKPTQGIVRAAAVRQGTAFYVHNTASNFGDGADVFTESGSETTCYDNNGSASYPHHYTLDVNKGQGPNCALIFRAF